jgi:hypothetical protein
VFQRGERLGRPAGGQETPADLGARVWSAPLLRGYQGDVGINVGLTIGDFL